MKVRQPEKRRKQFDAQHNDRERQIKEKKSWKPKKKD